MSIVWSVRKKSEFTQLRTDGVWYRQKFISFVFVPDSTISPVPPRVAFAISKKVGPAVIRNRVRRKIKALFYEAVKNEKVIPGLYMVTVKPEIVNATFQELHTHFFSLIEQTSQHSRKLSC